MDVVNEIQFRLDQVIVWALVLLQLWAFIDCSLRKGAAFPAVDKLTKPAWMGIIGVTALLAVLIQSFLFSMIAVIAALVYLVDVRPAVREISGGGRW